MDSIQNELLIKISWPVRKFGGKTAVIRTVRPNFLLPHIPLRLKILGREKREFPSLCMKIAKCPRVIVKTEQPRLSPRQNDASSSPANVNHLNILSEPCYLNLREFISFSIRDILWRKKYETWYTLSKDF